MEPKRVLAIFKESPPPARPSRPRAGANRHDIDVRTRSDTTAARDSGSLPAYIGRQAIYDRAMRTVGFELLFRDGTADRAVVTSSEASTAEVMLGALSDIGLETLTAGRRAFVNMSLEFLMSDRVALLPPERFALEVLEWAHTSPLLAGRLRELSALGYPIALDDFVLTDATVPLVAVADIVKLDVLALGERRLEAHVQALRDHPVRLLAEKVEDAAAFERCAELGFDYFQGYVFGRPETATSRRIPSDQRTSVELLAELQRPGSTLEDLEAVIIRDVGASLRLLRYINSAAVAPPRRIGSIREAILLIGERQVRNFATLLAMTRAGAGSNELTRIATTRAKMLELVASAAGDPDPSAHFTVGLLSTLDALLGAPMDAVCDGLPLTGEVVAALTRRGGPYGDRLRLVIDYLDGWPVAGPRGLRDAFLQAIQWADLTTAALAQDAA
ncbi:MAG TPA: HDOD domain-containing protein [Gaiellaceae bacterium]|jgi:EAL and modified HD-GYP domain-containing signal transduction protein|nr:HDOD domain-containing protein [Gaiellaceae bacterium]